MYKYTIKKSDIDKIVLLDDQNKVINIVDILDKFDKKRVFAFEGKMGAGKTTFIKHICEALGTQDVVNSPTFANVNVNEIAHGNELYHFDCYRIKDVREAMDLGAEEYLYSGNYCFIEWAEMIEPLLPNDTIWVKIEVLENGDRNLLFFC